MVSVKNREAPCMENMENNIPEEEKLEPLAVEAEPVIQEAPVEMAEEVPAQEVPVEEAPAEETLAVEDTTYHYVPSRRVSPYADSPYVMEETPAPAKRVKKRRQRRHLPAVSGKPPFAWCCRCLALTRSRG